MKFDEFLSVRKLEGEARGRCCVRASGFLPHSADRRPVAVAERRGRQVRICQGCLDALRTERWARRMGLGDMGEGAVAALRGVLFAEAGYRPPARVNHLSASIWHALRELERRRVVQRVFRQDPAGVVQTLFAVRDACPHCLRRRGHADACARAAG